MRALDTNVLVRLLMRDDEAQWQRVDALVREAERARETLFVGEIVLIELVWVLKRIYKLSRQDLVTVLEALLDTAYLDVENAELVTVALESFRRGKADFSDYLVREHALFRGADHVLTFDANALDDEGFRAP